MCERRLEKIRALNDEFRALPNKMPLWSIVVTERVRKLGEKRVREIILQVECCKRFSPKIDVTTEHKMGRIRNRGVPIRWFVLYAGYGDNAWSPDPANPRVTSRQLNIWLESEFLAS